MKRIALITVILVICVCVPNLIWLANSTARITNGGANTLGAVVVHVDDKETKLGDLPPGRSRFIFLPKAGDAIFKVSYRNGASLKSVCQEYVEGDMYHVETVLSGSPDAECKVTLALVSELFILKALKIDVI